MLRKWMLSVIVFILSYSMLTASQMMVVSEVFSGNN